MRNNKLLRNIILYKGIIMLILGIIHIIFTFTYEFNKLNGTVPVNFLYDYLAWFLAVGVFITFIGSLDIISFYELKYKLNGIWRITLCSSVFTLIVGTIGTLYFREGPPILILLLGIISIVPVLLQRKDFTL